MRGISGTGWSMVKNGRAYCRACNKSLNSPPVCGGEEHTEYYRKNLVNSGTWNKRMRAETRQRALLYLGGKCVGKTCGITDLRLLTFNHTVGGGRQERLSLDRMTFYRAILKGERPDIEIRCYNCQVLYEHERGARE